jgi:hypothetical protein
VSPSEIAFLAAGLVIGAAIGAAIGEALRARPAPRRQVRLTISPNSVSPRRSATLADPAAAAGRPAMPGSPEDGALRGVPAAAATLRSDPPGSTPAPGGPGRTPVPSAPVAMPAGAVAVPVAPASSVPVGPGQAATLARGPSPSGGQAPRASARGGTGVGVLDPVRPVETVVIAPLPASLDVGSVAPGIAVRPRPPVAAPRPTLGGGTIALPIVASAGRRGAEEPVGGPMSMTPASADPCDVPRRLVDERCEVATAARDRAKAAADALREAQRAYDTLRDHVERAERTADPREVAAAKDELHRRFRAASDVARGAEAAEAAAREWLAAINDLNKRSREAARLLERSRGDLAASVPRIERLAVEADAARIAAETAEVGCRDARERLAACEEEQARSAVPVPPVPARDPDPFEGQWPGESESTRTQSMGSPAAAAMEGSLPVVVLVLRGDREARERLVAQLAAGDAAAARTWQLRLSALVDAITARAIEDGYLDLPEDDPFWGLFTYAERRDIVGALSALGYRFDGLGGFADGRVPAARDLALAVGYAGLDRMRIRTWPRESDTAALFERATVAADLWLAERADDLSLGQMVDALGSRAGDLADIWNAWGRIRPALLADA